MSKDLCLIVQKKEFNNNITSDYRIWPRHNSVNLWKYLGQIRHPILFQFDYIRDYFQYSILFNDIIWFHSASFNLCISICVHYNNVKCYNQHSVYFIDWQPFTYWHKTYRLCQTHVDLYKYLGQSSLFICTDFGFSEW